VRRSRYAARTTGNFTMQIDAEATLVLYCRYSPRRDTILRDFDVLLPVHLSVILAINQLDAQNLVL
jgi:hypothetical protein